MAKETKEEDMTALIFIKSYPSDFPWLEYCLRSIRKFASGFREVVVVVPKVQVLSEKSWLRASPQVKVLEAVEYGHDGYLSQQVFKLYADTFTDDTDYILHIDSDTIFTSPVTPETYFTNGKIDWMMTPYALIETPWQPITEKFLTLLRHPIEFEFMRRAPQMIPRWLYGAIREFCVLEHGCTIDQYIMKQPYRAFSEYNVLGALAYYYHRDKFNWINTAETPESEWPTLTVLQKYSHGGLTPDIVAEFEQILAL